MNGAHSLAVKGWNDDVRSQTDYVGDLNAALVSAGTRLFGEGNFIVGPHYEGDMPDYDFDARILMSYDLVWENWFTLFGLRLFSRRVRIVSAGPTSRDRWLVVERKHRKVVYDEMEQAGLVFN